MLTILEWLKTMRDGRAPKIPSTTGNDFFTTVVMHLGYFCRLPDAEGPDIVARAAMDGHLRICRAKRDSNTLGLIDLRRFGQFNWLATETEMAEVKLMTDGVLGNVNTKAPGSAKEVPKSSASSSSSSGSTQPRAATKTRIILD